LFKKVLSPIGLSLIKGVKLLQPDKSMFEL